MSSPIKQQNTSLAIPTGRRPARDRGEGLSQNRGPTPVGVSGQVPTLVGGWSEDGDPLGGGGCPRTGAHVGWGVPQHPVAHHSAIITTSYLGQYSPCLPDHKASSTG